MPAPKTLVWDDAMTTGFPELDAQHKYLINFINELGYSINKKYDPMDIVKVLKVMKFFTEWHFSKEEECMERYRCPIAGKNQKAHAVFLERLQEYQKEYEISGGSSELALRIHSNLVDWVTNHIMIMDTQLSSYAQPTNPLKT